MCRNLRRLMVTLVLLILSAKPSLVAAQVPVLVFKDGTTIGVLEYRVVDGIITYRSSYGGENRILLTQVDMEQTYQVNAHRGTAIDLTEQAPVERLENKGRQVTADTGEETSEPPVFNLALAFPPPASFSFPSLITDDNLAEVLCGTLPPNQFGPVLAPEFLQSLEEPRREEFQREVKWRTDVVEVLQATDPDTDQELIELKSTLARYLTRKFEPVEEEDLEIPSHALGMPPEALEARDRIQKRKQQLQQQREQRLKELREQALQQGLSSSWLRPPRKGTAAFEAVQQELEQRQEREEQRAALEPWEFLPHDEYYWRLRFREARLRIEELQLKVSQLQEQVQVFGRTWHRWLTGTAAYQGKMTSIYGADYFYRPFLAQKQKELAEAKRELQRAREEFAELETQLRREGGPAGWAR